MKLGFPTRARCLIEKQCNSENAIMDGLRSTLNVLMSMVVAVGVVACSGDDTEGLGAFDGSGGSAAAGSGGSPGNDGSSGSAGASGAAGSSGAGGASTGGSGGATGGQGGTGGSGGQAGTGGSGGQAGTAGTGGTAGAGGTAGSTGGVAGSGGSGGSSTDGGNQDAGTTGGAGGSAGGGGAGTGGTGGTSSDAGPQDSTSDTTPPVDSGRDAVPCRAAGTIMVTNQGSSAYVIDGMPNPALTLCRGSTYTFAVNTPTHPFYIKTVASTGAGNAYSNGVTGNGTTAGNVTFVVPSSAPDLLFYVCSVHAPMQGMIHIVN